MYFRSFKASVKGFTLIELLVVISIIALLLAILMPALGRAKELAQEIVCRNIARQLAVGNSAYAAQNKGAYIYTTYKDTANPNGSNEIYRWGISVFDLTSDEYWCLNPEYLVCVGMTDDQIHNALNPSVPEIDININWGAQWPKGYRCPEWRDLSEQMPWKHKVSYGYNMGGPDATVMVAEKYPAVYKQSTVKRPSAKLMFADSQCWWITQQYADWDAVLSNPLFGSEVYEDRIWYAGGILYRHKEGATVAYYDGHADKRDMEDTFYFDDQGGRDYEKTRTLWDLRK